MNHDELNNKFSKLHDRWVKGECDDVVGQFLFFADSGITKAQIAVAVAFSCGGWGFDKNTDLAIEYAKMAEESDDPYNYLTLAFIYDPSVERSDEYRKKYTTFIEAKFYYHKAFESYQKEAEAGNPDGMSGLSDCYSCGWGVKVDEKKARYWLDQTYLTRTGKTFSEFQKENE